MSSAGEQTALEQIRKYLDAGHSIDAIREAGWGEWGFAAFGLFWMIRHLVESPESRMQKEIERMRRSGKL